MKLYERNLRQCVMMKPESIDDGEGGTHITYTDGVSFMAAIVPESSLENRIGEKERTLAKYTVTVPHGASDGYKLSYGDRFRTVDDGRCFIVTGECSSPPASSVIGFTQVTAEAWLADESDGTYEADGTEVTA